MLLENVDHSVQQILDNLSENKKSDRSFEMPVTLPNQPPSTVIDNHTFYSSSVSMPRQCVQNTEKTTTLRSKNEPETKATVGKLLLKQWNKVGNPTDYFARQWSRQVNGFRQRHCGISRHQVKLGFTNVYHIEEYPFLRGQTKGQTLSFDMWKVDWLTF